jgi:ketosteroid isomerase-like protein
MRPFVLALAITASAACAADAPHLGHFEPSDRAAIAAVLGNQVAAWNRGDLAGYMDGYARTPALVFTSGGNVRHGWQDAFDHYQARYATDPKAMGTLAFAIDSIDPVGADGAVVLGRWDLTGTAHPGRGVFTVVLERRPEGWRIIHDHTSVAADSPP